MIFVEYITTRTVSSNFQEWTEEELEQFYYCLQREEEQKQDAMRGDDQ